MCHVCVGTNKENETDGADRQSRKSKGDMIGLEKSTGNSTTKNNDTYSSIVTKNTHRLKTLRLKQEEQPTSKLIILSQSNS